MFDQLFRAPYAVARQRDGPLAEERHRYLVHLAARQMAAHTLRNVANYVLAVAKALRLADRPGELIPRAEIEAEADRWAGRQYRGSRMRKARRSWLNFTRNAVAWLAFLGRLQPPVTVQRPYADHLARFTDYVLRERGLAPQTVEQYRWTIDKFLAQID